MVAVVTRAVACHPPPMPTRSSKLRDVNQLAAAILGEATGETIDDAPAVEPATSTKNPAAVALGKLGGAKGGVARAKALSPKRRSQIAKKAARARWDQSR